MEGEEDHMEHQPAGGGRLDRGDRDDRGTDPVKKPLPADYIFPRLPPPPAHGEDVVNDLGWLSHGISERFRREAREALRPLLLGENEPSPLPPDPDEPPPLPPSPGQDPDTEEWGG